MSACHYKIVWSTEHASGELPGIFLSFKAALGASRDWYAHMVSVDDNPEDASHEYQWEVIRVHPPIPERGSK
jgi:hypothetical protein